MGALGYGGGNVDQKELALKVKISKPATAGTYLSVFDFCSGRCRHNSESVVRSDLWVPVPAVSVSSCLLSLFNL
ncbi:hypothetical protein LOK49_LG13G00120 [Camellia lanceoleosa]|uniref:Uncharacterized protein n=1 Tax=Camellia lanceoleosa TaxID=1840588 RepID=A0ACC0FNG3_9ERIC|nr:hypothetical protein LOK49_LG13G00120 [Camellia lanceoleosa]